MAAARRLLVDDRDTALTDLAAIHRRAPELQGAVGRRGLLAVIEQLGPDDNRVGAYRRPLARH